MLGDTVMGGMSPLVDYRLKDLYGIDAQTPTGEELFHSALGSLMGSGISHLLAGGSSTQPEDGYEDVDEYLWKDTDDAGDFESENRPKTETGGEEKNSSQVENSGNGEYNEAQGGSIKIPMNDGTEVELPQTPSYAEGYDSHLVTGQLMTGKKRDRGVSGGHNMEEFNQVLADAGFNVEECLVDVKEHPTIPGIYEVYYRIPVKNQQNMTVPGQYREIRDPKTVYDPAVISDEQMLQWGREAMEEGMRNNRVKVDNKGKISVTGYSNNGIQFVGYLDTTTKKITNFFPTLNDRRQ